MSERERVKERKNECVRKRDTVNGLDRVREKERKNEREKELGCVCGKNVLKRQQKVFREQNLF